MGIYNHIERGVVLIGITQWLTPDVKYEKTLHATFLLCK